MALLKTAKAPRGSLETLRDDLHDLLKPTAATFSAVSTESFHNFYTQPDHALVSMSVDSIAAQLEPTFKTSLENMGYGSAEVKQGELKTNSGAGVAGFGAKVSDAQIAAASMVALAMRDTKSAVAYAQAASNTAVAGAPGVLS